MERSRDPKSIPTTADFLPPHSQLFLKSSIRLPTFMVAMKIRAEQRGQFSLPKAASLALWSARLTLSPLQTLSFTK